MTTRRFAARLKVLEGRHDAGIALLRRLRAMTDDELDAELRCALAAAGFDLAAMHCTKDLPNDQVRHTPTGAK